MRVSPHIWGLASFGQEGVETVIELLRRELQVIMGETGAASIANIRRDSLFRGLEGSFARAGEASQARDRATKIHSQRYEASKLGCGSVL